MPYFVVLSSSGPDEVIRAISTVIARDEKQHPALQIDQLRLVFAAVPAGARVLILAAWWCVAVAAATVVTVDNGAALRACGLDVGSYRGAALRSFRRAAAAALW